jgi:hypothetical protein
LQREKAPDVALDVLAGVLAAGETAELVIVGQASWRCRYANGSGGSGCRCSTHAVARVAARRRAEAFSWTATVNALSELRSTLTDGRSAPVVSDVT